MLFAVRVLDRHRRINTPRRIARDEFLVNGVFAERMDELQGLSGLRAPEPLGLIGACDARFL